MLATTTGLRGLLKKLSGKPSQWYTFLEWLGWTTLFALAYAQEPLYTSNQNQYFLHAAARAGRGLLHEDWLAQTLDPTPVFSWLSELVFRFLQPDFFYFIYALLLGVYLLSLRSIGRRFLKSNNLIALQFVYTALLLFLNSAGLRALMSLIPGPYWKYFFEAGVAGQRALGAVLQPSSFAVFLLLSIALYLDKKEIAAIIAVVIACSFHPTYLLSAAVLVAAMLLNTFIEERDLAKTLKLGGIALVLVLPITMYVYLSFQGASANITQQSQDILIHYRIPHHAIISEWLDITVLAKSLVLFLALYLTRKSRLFYLMFVPALSMFVLTIAQAISGSDQLALLFPWRMSVWLYPLAISVIAAHVLNWSWEKFLDRSGIVPVSILATALLAVFGGLLFSYQITQHMNAPERPMLDFVAETKQPGQVYMIPHKLQTFRLQSGAPALVEGKAIPYAADEVLEWYDRHRLTTWFYRDSVDQIDCDLLITVQQEYQVTHVVLSARQYGLDCPGMLALYSDDSYAVIELIP